MIKDIQRFLGRTVEIIYLDRRGVFSKRVVQLHAVRDGRVNVFCLERQAPRILRVENVLAVQPVMRNAS